MTFVTICYATTYRPTSWLATKVMDELAVATWRVQWDAFTGRAGRIPPPSGDCHRSANFRYNPAQLPNLNFSSSSTRAEEDIAVNLHFKATKVRPLIVEFVENKARMLTRMSCSGCLTLEMKFKSMPPPQRSRFPPMLPRESSRLKRLFRCVGFCETT